MRVNAGPLGTSERMYRAMWLLSCCAILQCCFAIVGCGVSREQQRQAVAAVSPWLQMVDAEKYDEGWRQTGDYFKGTITLDRWKELMTAYRRPHGGVLSRSVTSVRRESSLPGVPDANYLVIKFNTVFEKKKKAVETVVTIVDPSGRPDVVGYYVE